MSQGQPSTLLVVLGAGASYDSLQSAERRSISGDEYREWHPPLAQELFDDRLSFGEILDRIPECAGLIGELRPRLVGGAPLEQELERIQGEAKDDPRLQRELMTLRLYLQQVLWRCGNRWLELSHGITNYVYLVRRLDQWRLKSGWRVCYVTFNYDLLLDSAIDASLRLHLNGVNAYISDRSYSYIKLHGSVNWWRTTSEPASIGRWEHAWRKLLDSLPQVTATNNYILRSPDIDEQQPMLIPAIAIPLERKESFECPEGHLAELDSRLRDTAKILVIGWRGAEQHFLARLDELVPGKAPPIEIVGGNEIDTEETAVRLSEARLSQQRMNGYSDGFSSYLATGKLEEFLYGEPRMVPTPTGWRNPETL